MIEFKKKIIIDTDNGDDIDDLFAIYLALKLNNQIDLIGVTTVYGNTNLRARQINKVLSLTDKKDIDVFAGCGVPLKSLHPLKTNTIFCQFSEDLNDDKYKVVNEADDCSGNQAIDYLINCAKKYQEQLTIVCIGPLTNIAKAILKDKKAMSKVNYVMMGGSFSKIEREWNIACDYLAAKIVFDSKLKLTCVGIDVTRKVEISKSLQEKILKTKGNNYQNYLIDCCNRWFKCCKRRIVLHDPLTLYYLVKPELFKVKKYHVSVETEGNLSIGLTIPLEELLWVEFDYIDQNQYSTINCAIDVKSKAFIKDFKNVLDF